MIGDNATENGLIGGLFLVVGAFIAALAKLRGAKVSAKPQETVAVGEVYAALFANLQAEVSRLTVQAAADAHWRETQEIHMRRCVENEAICQQELWHLKRRIDQLEAKP